MNELITDILTKPDMRSEDVIEASLSQLASKSAIPWAAAPTDI